MKSKTEGLNNIKAKDVWIKIGKITTYYQLNQDLSATLVMDIQILTAWLIERLSSPTNLQRANVVSLSQRANVCGITCEI